MTPQAPKGTHENGHDKTKTAEMVQIQLDGRHVLLPRGKNLLEALLEAGEQLSYFCYHPGLSVVAQCRQCLVGLGDAHKLVPACQLKVEAEMKIRSNTEQVRQSRQALLEFTLLNHPVDCVICDKAGECTLQRHYMDWDGQQALVNHQKVRKPKKVDLGPDIVLDSERCILCSRCIRFCAEIAGEPQLVFSERGDHTILTTAPGKRLDSAYALNTVDICPVGALTDKDFRFKSRVWDLLSTQSVCNGCSAGCSMEIHHKGGQIYRLVPQKRWDMNANWMCNYGRRTYKDLSQDRLSYPLADGAEVDLDVAFERVASRFGEIRRRGEQNLGLVLGTDASNEDNFVAARLGRVLGARLYLGDRPDDGNGDGILRRNDPNPNRAGARACGGDSIGERGQLLEDINKGLLRGLYVIGNGLTLGETDLQRVRTLEFIVVQSTHQSDLARIANVLLPAAAWAEVDATVTNDQHRVKRMHSALEPPGYAQPHWKLLVCVARALGQSWSFDGPRDVFGAMTDEVSQFAGAQWDTGHATRRLRWSGRRG